MTMMKMIDIGANLTDSMYSGFYNGSKKHSPDLASVLKRAWDGGLDKIFITGGNVEESKKAIELCRQEDNLFSTVGCHPTRCSEFEKFGEPDDYLKSLENIIKEGGEKVVAVGECGLDYDRLKFCPKDIQKKYFEKQLDLVEATKLPLFLHCRNAFSDFISILNSNKERLHGGVVHSFDGTLDEAMQIIELGYSIGINGCSLKKEENLEVVKNIPNDRLMLETDCPWCEVKPTHAGYKYIKTTFPTVKKEKWLDGKMVKGRNEPVNIIQVLEIVAAIKNEDKEKLCKTLYENTCKLFF